MAKIDKSKKTKPVGAPQRSYSPEAQELRALLRRIPDGFQATLTALASREPSARERVMSELARGMGKEILPLVRAAATGANEALALSALRVLPVFATRAAADVLVEAHQKYPDGERAQVASRAAQALRAQGISVAIPEPEVTAEAPRYVLRETWISAPDGVGSRSVVARLQDQYGVWHAVLVLWNDQAGVKDGFMRPFSRQEWEERAVRLDDRGTTQVQCPPDYARWQVATARALNEKTGFPIKKHLDAWETHIGTSVDGYTPPDPREAVRSASPEAMADWVLHSQEFFQQQDLARWFLEAADCAGWAKRWTDLQNRYRRRAREQSEEDGLKQAVIDLVREAAEELLTAEKVALYRGRLLDLARVYEWRQQTEPARRAAAVVCALDDGQKPSEIPFFIALVQWSLRATEVLLSRGEDLERTRYRPMRQYQS